MNSAARMAFLETQTVCDMSFLVEFALQICRFRWNFSFPDRSFSTEFSIPSMCRIRWNFGMYPMFKYFLFKTIFQRFTPGKQRFVSLLKDFGHKYFLKTFSGAQRRTKNVVFCGILGELICRFGWNLEKSNTSF